MSAKGREMKLTEEKKLAGCCGIYCGLCPRFQSTAPSRCPGCKVLCQTLSCKRYNCPVKQHGFATCAECGEFPCDKYDKFFDGDSFVSHRVCLPNIESVKKVGLSTWLREQNRRRVILEGLLAKYNEGRSMSFYCVATALVSPDAIKKLVTEAQRRLAAEEVDDSDIKAKAKTVRATIQEYADAAGVALKLRHAKK